MTKLSIIKTASLDLENKRKKLNYYQKVINWLPLRCNDKKIKTVMYSTYSLKGCPIFVSATVGELIILLNNKETHMNVLGNTSKRLWVKSKLKWSEHIKRDPIHTIHNVHLCNTRGEPINHVSNTTPLYNASILTSAINLPISLLLIWTLKSSLLNIFSIVHHCFNTTLLQQVTYLFSNT